MYLRRLSKKYSSKSRMLPLIIAEKDRYELEEEAPENLEGLTLRFRTCLFFNLEARGGRELSWESILRCRSRKYIILILHCYKEFTQNLGRLGTALLSFFMAYPPKISLSIFPRRRRFDRIEIDFRITASIHGLDLLLTKSLLCRCFSVNLTRFLY